jgi:uncharacterized protein YkwD
MLRICPLTTIVLSSLILLGGCDSDESDDAADTENVVAVDAGVMAPSVPDMAVEPVDPLSLSPETACDVIDANWPVEWVEFEDEVLVLTNERRANDQNCGTGGQHSATGPLGTDPLLKCAARRHSLDMIQRSFFDHVSPDGVTPDTRIIATGYAFRGMGENIAAGVTTPEAVVQGWMDSDPHCRNIMVPNFEELGVGLARTPNGQFKLYWTQVFGTPAP